MSRARDVVIIGGGIVGCSLAYAFGRRMKGVTVVEGKGIASQSSGANYGMVWHQTRLPGFDLIMALRSLKMYEELVSDVFDVDIEFERAGGMTVFLSWPQVQVARAVVEEKRKLGIDVQVIGREDCLELEPNLTPEVVGATYSPVEAQLNPMKTTFAFARAAKRSGVEILTETEVTGLHIKGGRVEGVATSRGDISTGLVINAAGAWSPNIGRMAGIDIKVWPQRLQSMVTEPVVPLLSRTLQGGRQVSEEDLKNPDAVFSFAVEMKGEPTEDSLPRDELDKSIFPYLKPTKNGNVVIGTTSEFVGYNKSTLPDAMKLMAGKAVELVPALKHAVVIRGWANFVPFTFDSLPMIGCVPSVKGLFLCCGHAHAVAHAPATAETVAKLIVDGHADVDLTEADVTRYDFP